MRISWLLFLFELTPKLAHRWLESHGYFSILLWNSALQQAKWSDLIIVSAPVLSYITGMLQTQKPVCIQALMLI